MKKLVFATMALSILLMAGCHDEKKHRGDRHEDVPPAGSCGDISNVGLCSGTVVKFCEDDELKEIDCKTKNQTCGKKTDDDGDYYDCVDSSTACGSITDVGVCDGTIVKYCKDNKLNTVDCKTKNQTCGKKTDAQGTYFDCVDGASEPGKKDYTCAELGNLGKCVDGVAKWCENNKIEEWDCSKEKDSVCGITDKNFAICSVGCGSVTTEGNCDGTKLSYCGDVTKEDGSKTQTLYTHDCNDDKKTCGKETKNGKTYMTCIDSKAPQGQTDPKPEDQPTP